MFEDSALLLPLALFNLLVLTGMAIAVGKSFGKSQRSAVPILKDQAVKSEINPEINSQINSEIAALKQECLQLRQQLENQNIQAKNEFHQATFSKLQSLFTQYPSLVKTIEAKPDLPAKNLVALLSPLDNLRQDWQYDQIGNVWEQVAYDPQIHQADHPEIQAGEAVYVRFVGYRDRLSDAILIPAKVSRTLPQALTRGMTQ
jgi:ribosomal protein L29